MRASLAVSKEALKQSNEPLPVLEELETLRAHCQQHDYPKHIKTCESCMLFHNLEKYRRLCVVTEPSTGDKVVLALLERCRQGRLQNLPRSWEGRPFCEGRSAAQAEQYFASRQSQTEAGGWHFASDVRA